MYLGILKRVKGKIENVNLTTIEQQFPIRGEYLFRAKTKLGKQIVYMDILDKLGSIPLFEGKIILKVSRISFEVKSSNFESEVKKEKEENNQSKISEEPQHENADLLNIF